MSFTLSSTTQQESVAYIRYIAETHYQLGLTHSFSKNYSEARLHFRHAIKVLESRVHNCKGVLDAAIKETGSRYDSWSN